jgi:hypothetical protein
MKELAVEDDKALGATAVGTGPSPTSPPVAASSSSSAAAAAAAAPAPTGSLTPSATNVAAATKTPNKSPVAVTVDPETDDKIVRRKVADVLNVLTAMGIVTRKKKSLTWVGIPLGSHASVEMRLSEGESLASRITKKRAELRDLYQQHIALHMLSEFNKARPVQVDEKDRIHVPFVIINTLADAKIQCEIGEDNQQVVFHFDAPFTIRDDYDVLKDMGLHTALPHIIEAIVPPEFRSLMLPEDGNNSMGVANEGAGGAAASSTGATGGDDARSSASPTNKRAKVG